MQQFFEPAVATSDVRIHLTEGLKGPTEVVCFSSCAFSSVAKAALRRALSFDLLDVLGDLGTQLQ